MQPHPGYTEYMHRCRIVGRGMMRGVAKNRPPSATLTSLVMRVIAFPMPQHTFLLLLLPAALAGVAADMPTNNTTGTLLRSHVAKDALAPGPDIFPIRACPTAENHTNLVSAACVKAQKAACARAGVEPAYNTLWGDAVTFGPDQLDAQCKATAYPCQIVQPGPDGTCCNVTLDWSAYAGDLRAFEEAAAPAGGGTDICVVSSAITYKGAAGRPQDWVMILGPQNVMPVAVAQVCTHNDRQYLIAGIAQQMRRLGALLPSGATFEGGSMQWSDAVPASSGINVGCTAPSSA